MASMCLSEVRNLYSVYYRSDTKKNAADGGGAGSENDDDDE